MPQIQVIDSTPNKAEPTGVEEFFSKLSQHYKDKQDKNILDEIYSGYAKNDNDMSRHRETSAAIQKSNLSPSKRLDAQKQLNEIEKINIENRKLLDKQASSAGKEYNKIREKAVASYVDDARVSGEAAQDQKFAISEARRAVKGDVSGPGWQAVVKNNPYGALAYGLTPDEALLNNANKQLLSGTKGLFGPRPTEREIFVLLNGMLPSIGKTKEANEIGLDFIEKVNDMQELKSNLVNEITEGGSKYVDNLEQQVKDKMKPVYDALLEDLKANKKYYVDPDAPNKDKKEPKLIKVKGPNGSIGDMTKEEIDAAKEKGVIFDPV